MKSRGAISPELNLISGKIMEAAYAVHWALGPGLLESVYEACLWHELTKRGLMVERQASLPIIYDDLHLEGGLKLDMLVEDSIVVELKAAEAFFYRFIYPRYSPISSFRADAWVCFLTLMYPR